MLGSEGLLGLFLAEVRKLSFYLSRLGPVRGPSLITNNLLENLSHGCFLTHILIGMTFSSL